MSSGSPSRRVGIERARVVAEVVDQHLREVGLHEPGSDPDDPHLRTELAAQLSSEVDERGLREVVDPEQPFGSEPADRGDVHDDAAVVLHPLPPGGLRPEDRALHVHLERLVVAALVDLHDRARVRVRRGVVDEDVEPTEPLDRARRRTARLPRRRRRSRRTRACRRRCSTLPRRAGRACATTASPSRPTRRSSSRSRGRCPSMRR